MNTLEIKGSILELLGKVQDKDLLVQIKGLLQKTIKQQPEATVEPDWLTDEQKEDLSSALEEIKNEANLVPHEEALKKFRTW